MHIKITQNYNLEKKNVNFVSYIITAYNKRKYIQSVFNALSTEGGKHKREYIVVDDGSTDNTSLILRKLAPKLPGKLRIIKRGNLGASYSTNEAIKMATGYWIRLLDGDDLITYKSTEKMLFLARCYKVSFVYGLISKENIKEYNIFFNYKKQSREEGLKKFIRNCPANSSSILVSKKRYFKAGGCDEDFVSPDQVLFLRLFLTGSAMFLNVVVARIPKTQKADRLSSQVKRSRYESILALINLCKENPSLEKNFLKQAYKRALSRANTYSKYFSKSYLSKYWIMYIISKFFFPIFYKKLMYESLKVFTSNKFTRPYKWKTGANKLSISSKFIKK